MVRVTTEVLLDGSLPFGELNVVTSDVLIGKLFDVDGLTFVVTEAVVVVDKRGDVVVGLTVGVTTTERQKR